MKIVNRNLWELYEEGENICITTNGYIKKNREGVMGAGCAKEASKKFPELPALLGSHLEREGNVVKELIPRVISFPVKNAWWEKASLDLIKCSFKTLTNSFPEEETFYLPKPGCGNGGLSWKDVEPLLDSMDTTHNVIIVDFPR